MVKGLPASAGDTESRDQREGQFPSRDEASEQRLLKPDSISGSQEASGSSVVLRG